MKRFIQQILFFILFTVVFYSIGICVFGELMPSFLRPNLKFTKNNGGYTLTRLSEVKKVSNIDILFVGSSHTYHGFDPRIFKEVGLTSFNLGTSAQTPLQTKFLLERYLDKVDPKEVIFQVSPFIFAIDGVESTVDILSNDIVDMQSVVLAMKVKDLNAYNSVIYSLYADIVGEKLEFIENSSLGKNTYISGGYVESADINYNSSQNIITNFPLISSQLQAFDEMITMVKEKGIKYHLVYVPITKPLYQAVSAHTNFEILMNEYGNYIDFNKRMSLDTTYFYDRHHLNKKGVQLFNEKLIKELLIIE